LLLVELYLNGHPLDNAPERPYERLHIFARITQAMKLIERERQGGDVRFWFSTYEPFGREYHSLNSTYLWGYTQIGSEFPKVPAEAVFHPGMLVVVPSANRHSGAIAVAAFRRPGLRLRIVSQTPIQSGGEQYFLNFLRVELDPEQYVAQGISFDGTRAVWRLGDIDSVAELPPEKWQPCRNTQEHNRLDPEPGGIAVNAPEQQVCIAEYGPLIASETGQYTFLLAYTQFSGADPHFATEEGVAPMAGRITLMRAPGKGRLQQWEASLHAGERFGLRIGKDQGMEAQILIQHLRAFRGRTTGTTGEQAGH